MITVVITALADLARRTNGLFRMPEPDLWRGVLTPVTARNAENRHRTSTRYRLFSALLAQSSRWLSARRHSNSGRAHQFASSRPRRSASAQMRSRGFMPTISLKRSKPLL